MIQNFGHQSSNEQIIGVQGCGKTTLFLERLRKKKSRTKFVFDYKNGELAHKMKLPPCGTPEALVEATARGGFVMMDRVKFFPGEPDRAFDLFAAFVREQIQILHGTKLIAADELQDYTFTSDGRKPLNLLSLCDVGRTLQLDVILVCQTWARIHWAVRNQATDIYVFRQSDAKALEPLTDKGFDPDEIRNLRDGEYLHRNLKTGETRKGGKAF